MVACITNELKYGLIRSGPEANYQLIPKKVQTSAFRVEFFGQLDNWWSIIL